MSQGTVRLCLSPSLATVRSLRTRCGAKEHWITNDQRSALIRFRLFSPRSPLASKLLVLVLDWTAVRLRKVFAFRRVGTELFGSRLHVKPPSHRSVYWRCEGEAEGLANPVMGVTARPTIQPISERFRLVAFQIRLEEKIFVLVTCVIGRSPLCELLHSRTAGQNDGRPR